VGLGFIKTVFCILRYMIISIEVHGRICV